MSDEDRTQQPSPSSDAAKWWGTGWAVKYQTDAEGYRPAIKKTE